MQNRAATFLLQLGLLAVVVAALPYKLFELDRYFVPKELALHAVAIIFAIILVARRRTVTIDVVDALLVFFLVWSAASSFFATNHWLAQRALGVSVASGVVFWGARRIGATGGYRPLLVAAAVATVLAAITALAQAYGFETDLFSQNRAPGGTFGNRNFVAHIAAIGLPALVWCTVTAKRPIGAMLGSLGAALVAAALVLSRSRGAWLAVAACVSVLAIPLVVSRKHWDRKIVGGRFARLVLAMVIAGTMATIIPNRLNWNSESPYLDSARGVVNYKGGSGRGRVAQYRNTLQMAAANPVFGVGPGNWPVRYVKFAPGGDRSIAADGMTANPWPSSDWVAFVSERGFIAAIALLGAFTALFLGAFRGWREAGGGDAVLARLVLAGTIVATMVVSAFDAALLLAAPALLVWTILGASAGARRRGRQVMLSRRAWAIAAAGTVLVAIASTARSATQTMAMSAVGQGGRTAGWVEGAIWDPGSYRINLKVAQLYARRGRCNAARPYARRAVSLFPYAPAARRVWRQCQ
jgi:O-antigen ligase